MLIVIWKTGWIGENCVGTAKLLCPGIHLLDKSIYRTAYMLCNLQGNVIGRSNHDSVQALLHSENLVHLGGNAGTAVCNTGNPCGSHGNLVCKLCILKSQKTGHDLDCTSREKHLVSILGIKNGVGGIFHDYSRF